MSNIYSPACALSFIYIIGHQRGRSVLLVSNSAAALIEFLATNHAAKLNNFLSCMHRTWCEPPTTWGEKFTKIFANLHKLLTWERARFNLAQPLPRFFAFFRFIFFKLYWHFTLSSNVDIFIDKRQRHTNSRIPNPPFYLNSHERQSGRRHVNVITARANMSTTYMLPTRYLDMQNKILFPHFFSTNFHHFSQIPALLVSLWRTHGWTKFGMIAKWELSRFKNRECVAWKW